jgi:hypothetical protein
MVTMNRVQLKPINDQRRRLSIPHSLELRNADFPIKDGAAAGRIRSIKPVDWNKESVPRVRPVRDGKEAQIRCLRRRHDHLRQRQARQASGAWASLPTDIVDLVTERLLGGDGALADYVVFRTVCSAWRACTEPMDIRAKPWSVHCLEDARGTGIVVLLHTPTARRVRVRLPEVRPFQIVGFSDGHLVLLHKRTATVPSACSTPSPASPSTSRQEQELFRRHANHGMRCLLFLHRRLGLVPGVVAVQGGGGHRQSRLRPLGHDIHVLVFPPMLCQGVFF